MKKLAWPLGILRVHTALFTVWSKPDSNDVSGVARTPVSVIIPADRFLVLSYPLVTEF